MQEAIKEYRLPTEAEWEYACRSGTTTKYYFGDEIKADLANYNRNFEKTTPVGKYPPNDFGLYDMHGNVWEWCQDDYDFSSGYQNTLTDGSAWLSGNISSKVRRGGSWNSKPYYCRSASRRDGGRMDHSNHIGFRIVCVAPRTT